MLEHVEPGEYELICLPLKIIGGDGAPAEPSCASWFFETPVPRP